MTEFNRQEAFSGTKDVVQALAFDAARRPPQHVLRQIDPDDLRPPAGMKEYLPSNRFPDPWPGGWWRRQV